MPSVQQTAALRGLRPVAKALGACGRRDVEPRHRLAGGGRELAHDPVHRRLLGLAHRPGPHRAQRELVAEEVGDAVGRQRETSAIVRPAAAAEPAARRAGSARTARRAGRRSSRRWRAGARAPPSGCRSRRRTVLRCQRISAGRRRSRPARQPERLRARSRGQHREPQRGSQGDADRQRRRDHEMRYDGGRPRSRRSRRAGVAASAAQAR